MESLYQTGPKSFPWLNFLQMLEQVRGLLQASEEKRQTSIAELSTKLQKVEINCCSSGINMQYLCSQFKFLLELNI